MKKPTLLLLFAAIIVVALVAVWPRSPKGDSQSNVVSDREAKAGDLVTNGGTAYRLKQVVARGTNATSEKAGSGNVK